MPLICSAALSAAAIARTLFVSSAQWTLRTFLSLLLFLEQSFLEQQARQKNLHRNLVFKHVAPPFLKNSLPQLLGWCSKAPSARTEEFSKVKSGCACVSCRTGAPAWRTLPRGAWTVRCAVSFGRQEVRKRAFEGVVPPLSSIVWRLASADPLRSLRTGCVHWPVLHSVCRFNGTDVLQKMLAWSSPRTSAAYFACPVRKRCDHFAQRVGRLRLLV